MVKEEALHSENVVACGPLILYSHRTMLGHPNRVKGLLRCSIALVALVLSLLSVAVSSILLLTYRHVKCGVGQLEFVPGDGAFTCPNGTQQDDTFLVTAWATASLTAAPLNYFAAIYAMREKVHVNGCGSLVEKVAELVIPELSPLVLGFVQGLAEDDGRYYFFFTSFQFAFVLVFFVLLAFYFWIMLVASCSAYVQNATRVCFFWLVFFACVLAICSTIDEALNATQVITELLTNLSAVRYGDHVEPDESLLSLGQAFVVWNWPSSSVLPCVLFWSLSVAGILNQVLRRTVTLLGSCKCLRVKLNIDEEWLDKRQPLLGRQQQTLEQEFSPEIELDVRARSARL